MSDDIRNDFIARVAPGKTFADVGPLWGTENEKMSVAWASGASDVTAVDIVPPGHELWDKLDDRLARVGSPGVKRLPSANLDRIDTSAHSWDVVHCSGIIYHCPNPMHTLTQLRGLAAEWLILTSMVVPETFSSPSGTVTMRPGQGLFIPALDAEAGQIASEFLTANGVIGATGVNVAVDEWDVTDYGPWWWLLSPSAVNALLVTAGFTIVDEGPSWGGRSHTVLARH